MQNKEWYSKNDILKIYPISNTTYKKRIRNLEPNYTKFIKSNSGTPTRLIHHSTLDYLFRTRRRLSSKETNNTIKWVQNHYWKYFGDIVPEGSDISDLKEKMRFFFNRLKSTQLKKTNLTLFYSIEKNPNDKYYHAHFLIDCAEDMLVLKDIKDVLELICEPNTKKVTRIYVKKYDQKHEKFGSIYCSKEKKYFYEILSN